MSLYSDFKKSSERELLQHLKDMVANQENEHQELDFKHIDSLNFLLKSDYQPRERKDKKCEFAKDLSAFANATGGVIIYGIEETYDDKTGFKSIKSFGRGIKKTDFNRDQLIQISNSAIVPSIRGLDVVTVQHPYNEDELILLVLIPETTNGATMVQAEGDHSFRYFQRQVTENKPMLNWQVRLVNNKIMNPQLVLKFDKGTGIYFVLFKNFESSLIMNFPKIKNVGRVLANQVGFVVRIPKIFTNSSNIYYFNELIHVKETKKYVEKMKIFNFPIFPGLEINTFPENFQFSIDFSKHDLFGLKSLSKKKYYIEFVIYADNTEPRIYRLEIDLTGFASQDELMQKLKLTELVDFPHKVYFYEATDILSLVSLD